MTQSKEYPLWLKKLPNRLTLLRILCIPIVVYLMSFHEDLPQRTVLFWRALPVTPTVFDIIAAITFSVAAITDFFDGWLARKFNLETMFGKLLDPLADKLLIISALIILVEKHRLAGWLAVIIIVRDLSINAIRIAAMDEGIQISSNWTAKTKTTLLDLGIIGLIVHGNLGGLSYLPFHTLGHIFMTLAVAASLISAAQYLFDYGKQLRRISKSNAAVSLPPPR